MSINPSAPYGAEQWMREDASENPNGINGRVKQDAIANIAARMDREIPGATPAQRTAWLLNFEKNYPVNFRPAQIAYHGDLKKLSATQKLAAANGDPNPAPFFRRKP